MSPPRLFGYALLSGQDGLATISRAAGRGSAPVVTVWCTGMIYASLKPIPQWHHPLVAPGYLLLAAYQRHGAAGRASRRSAASSPGRPASSSPSAWPGLVLKIAYWRMVDGGMGGPTAESATSLGFIGSVRPLDPPHTETNYLLREMGFRLARKHAAKLRNLTLLLGFGGPILLALLATQPRLRRAAAAAGGAAGAGRHAAGTLADVRRGTPYRDALLPRLIPVARFTPPGLRPPAIRS